MRDKLLFSSLILIFSCSVTTYKSYPENKNVNIFNKGLYIENLNITIPWEFALNDLSKYGNSKIISKSKFLSELRWDSVKILNGIKARLSCFVNKISLNQNSLLTPSSFLAIFDERYIKEVTNQFEKYSGRPGKPVKTNKKKNRSFYWFLDNCSINVGWDKNYGGYMRIQRPVLEPQKKLSNN
jgi:hypothetical protein